VIKKRLFIVITGRNFANKTQKSAFFIKKNDYICMETIEIKCTGSDTIDIDQLTEFQGELKERSAGDVEKIIKSIKTNIKEYLI
jgi:uncharacterized protein YqfB (UPF0267 family)